MGIRRGHTHTHGKDRPGDVTLDFGRAGRAINLVVVVFSEFRVGDKTLAATNS